MSWKCWTARLLIVALAIPAFGGCKQQLFLEPGDYKDAVSAGLPKDLEKNAHQVIVPPVIDPHALPSTVNDPMRPPRYITLKECIAVALEQGNEWGRVWEKERHPSQFQFRSRWPGDGFHPRIRTQSGVSGGGYRALAVEVRRPLDHLDVVAEER